MLAKDCSGEIGLCCAFVTICGIGVGMIQKLGGGALNHEQVVWSEKIIYK